jgi:VCBS repeat-containing protein
MNTTTTKSASFGNTPQAQDDLFDKYTEDNLLAGEVFLDVMSNDLGGKAKTLFSIDNAETVEDLRKADSAGVWEETADGNMIKIGSKDGIVGIWFKLGDANKAKVDALSEGEPMTDTFAYTIRLANGTFSIATVTVTIIGSNDVPTATAAVNAVYEDDSILDGQVTGHDTDEGETEDLTFELVEDAPEGLTFNSDGTYTFDASSYDSLKEGETKDIVVKFVAKDALSQSEEQTLTITITGKNDAAIITGTSTGEVSEDGATPGSATATGDLNSEDVDGTADSFKEVTSPAKASYGTYTVTANGVWEYTLDNTIAAVNALAAGEILQDSFDVESEDGTTKTVTITINGADEEALGVRTVAAPPTFDLSGNGQQADPNDNDINKLSNTTVDVPRSGNDNLVDGGTGNDVIDTGPGADTINGGGGNDTLNGGKGMDTVRGEAGNDTLYGSEDNDTLTGGPGVDTIYGGSGDDTIRGGSENDTLYGGSGKDTIYGDENNDTIVGGFGADNLYGNGGVDTFVYLDNRDTGDKIHDFTANVDKIDFQALLSSGVLGFSADKLQANSVFIFQEGNNTIVQVDTNGNADNAELEITLVGVSVKDLDAQDFVL